MFRNFVFGSLVLLLFSLSSSAQEKEVIAKGYFLEDSIKIGISTPYVLTAKYPINKDVVFPDSLFDYNPLELGEKLYFPTKSDSKYSYDSAIYYLTTFEIDTVQYYQLPVFLVSGGDSIKILVERDSILLTQLVTEIPDSVAAEAMPLIENTAFKNVRLAFNYPYLIAGLCILFVVVLIIFIFFGKRIRKWFILKRLNKKHLKFLSQFDDLLYNGKNGPDFYEHVLQLWKKYLEDLEGKPYTKMTTKEMSKYDHIATIAPLLGTLDRAIYGKQNGIENKELDQFRFYSQERYNVKVKEVKNG
ncbi:MAG TPA: hypothetical protein PKL31_15885 [Fulvivirga sp.]|nr:hypothetical protein [Fulvivirga sp.]